MATPPGLENLTEEEQIARILDLAFEIRALHRLGSMDARATLQAMAEALSVEKTFRSRSLRNPRI